MARYAHGIGEGRVHHVPDPRVEVRLDDQELSDLVDAYRVWAAEQGLSDEDPLLVRLVAAKHVAERV